MMAKGDVVLIRSSKGEPGVRRIWDDSVNDPYVCLEVYWGRWERNRVEPVCSPIDKQRVYFVDENLLPQLVKAFESETSDLETLWSQAKPYH